MTDQEFHRIANYMEDKCGINLSQKRVLIEGRLESYLSKNGFESYGKYMDYVERDITGKEAERLVNILTTNHTYFMREFEHFDFLKEEVLPQLKKKESMNKDLRIWCGASSTGEEPYTLEMVLSDFFALEMRDWDTTVLATDISTEVLQIAKKGIYQEEHIRNIPPAWRQRYFNHLVDGQYEVKEEIRRRVLFRQFNLMQPLPFRKELHVVFLRNVMIYFEKDTKEQLLRRIYESMVPGGYLFVGTTESIDRGKTGFGYVKPSIYQKPC